VTPAPDVQLLWFSTALEELPAFLRSSDIFRPLHHPPPGLPQDLSLGGLLLAADVVSCFPDDLLHEMRAVKEQSLRRWEADRSSHAAAIEIKARAELRPRMNLWRAYLQDLEERPAEASAYASEVRHRVMIERLVELTGGRPDGLPTGRLDRADRELRAWLEPGSFLWSAALTGVYPQPRYWFLYGRPTAERILSHPSQT
jgi:hypothetical protein